VAIVDVANVHNEANGSNHHHHWVEVGQVEISVMKG
jgi:hypothetical protein